MELHRNSNMRPIDPSLQKCHLVSLSVFKSETNSSAAWGEKKSAFQCDVKKMVIPETSWHCTVNNQDLKKTKQKKMMLFVDIFWSAAADCVSKAEKIK